MTPPSKQLRQRAPSSSPPPDQKARIGKRHTSSHVQSAPASSHTVPLRPPPRVDSATMQEDQQGSALSPSRPLETLLKLVNRLQAREQRGQRRAKHETLLGGGQAATRPASLIAKAVPALQLRQAPATDHVCEAQVLQREPVCACAFMTLADGGVRARWRQHRRRATSEPSQRIRGTAPDRRGRRQGLATAPIAFLRHLIEISPSSPLPWSSSAAGLKGITPNNNLNSHPSDP
jgi:hypothetical protein